MIMDEIDIKLNEYYAGKVVRKDLTKSIKEGANVPSYVLEYLLGMYCATDDEEDIENGTQHGETSFGRKFCTSLTKQRR
jgi:ATP-dependent Lon protease